MINIKRALAKQLDSVLNTIYNMRKYGTMPTAKNEANYQEVYNLLYDDGLLDLVQEVQK